MREWGFETVVEDCHEFKLYRPKNFVTVGTRYHKDDLYENLMRPAIWSEKVKEHLLDDLATTLPGTSRKLLYGL